MKKKNETEPVKSELILYQTEDGKTRIDVCLQDETVWLSQKLMAELFQKDVRTINEHIKNIFSEGELVPEAVIRNFRITAADVKNYDTSMSCWPASGTSDLRRRSSGARCSIFTQPASTIRPIPRETDRNKGLSVSEENEI